MKFEITVDETLLKDLFVINPTDDKQVNRMNRLRNHVLTGSNELWKEWEKLEETSEFKNNPLLLNLFGNWLTDTIHNPRKYRPVHLSETSKVRGEPTEKERVMLGTAYESRDKIVVGDYSPALRQANPDIKFVPKESFSQDRAVEITLRDVESVLDSASNLKKNWFKIFETPIELKIPSNGSSDLLARYLATFYDDRLVIQDKFFVSSDGNEQNFVDFVLNKLPDKSNCLIELRVMVNQTLGNKAKAKKNRYESMTGCNITVKCIQEDRENLHEGYFESSTFRLQVPYRLNVFGRNNRTEPDTIRIRRK